ALASCPRCFTSARVAQYSPFDPPASCDAFAWSGGREHFLGRPAFGGAPASFHHSAALDSPISIGRLGSLIHSLHDPAYIAASMPARPRAKTPCVATTPEPQ